MRQGMRGTRVNKAVPRGSRRNDAKDLDFKKIAAFQSTSFVKKGEVGRENSSKVLGSK